MRKKEFLKLIQENKDIFKCLTLSDASITNVSKHTSIDICWRNQNNHKTTVKVMRGYLKDLRCIEELNKYNRWIQQSKK